MKQENLVGKYWRCIACHTLNFTDVYEWVRGEPTCKETCSKYYKKFLREIKAEKRNRKK